MQTIDYREQHDNHVYARLAYMLEQSAPSRNPELDKVLAEIERRDEAILPPKRVA